MKKLSPKQVEILKRLLEVGELKLTYDIILPQRTVKSLIKIGIVDYNTAFDGIVITDEWKDKITELIK